MDSAFIHHVPLSLFALLTTACPRHPQLKRFHVSSKKSNHLTKTCSFAFKTPSQVYQVERTLRYCNSSIRGSILQKCFMGTYLLVSFLKPRSRLLEHIIVYMTSFMVLELLPRSCTLRHLCSSPSSSQFEDQDIFRHALRFGVQCMMAVENWITASIHRTIREEFQSLKLYNQCVCDKFDVKHQPRVKG